MLYGYNNWGFLSCASHLYLSFSEPPSLKEFFLDNDSHLWRLYHILSTVLLSGLSTVKMRDSQLSNIKCSAHRIWTILKSFYFICQFPRKTAAQYIYIFFARIHVVHFNDIIIYIAPPLFMDNEENKSLLKRFILFSLSPEYSNKMTGPFCLSRNIKEILIWITLF